MSVPSDDVKQPANSADDERNRVSRHRLSISFVTDSATSDLLKSGRAGTSDGAGDY